MATSININIADDAKAARIIDAVSATYGYPDEIPDPAWVDPEDGTAQPMVENPQTKKQFVQQTAKQWLRDVTRAHELNAARTAAVESVDELAI